MLMNNHVDVDVAATPPHIGTKIENVVEETSRLDIQRYEIQSNPLLREWVPIVG